MEERIHPPMHPGRVLELEFLKPLKVTPYELAKAIGVDAPRVYEIVRGRRAISADSALRLARYFGTSQANMKTKSGLSTPTFVSACSAASRPATLGL
jgi:addiction module HigA family antidote